MIKGTNYNYEIKEVHISTIKVGDTVNHHGEHTTVCKNHITGNSAAFMGICLFGDSYHSGHKMVEKVVIITPPYCNYSEKVN